MHMIEFYHWKKSKILFVSKYLKIYAILVDFNANPHLKPQRSTTKSHVHGNVKHAASLQKGWRYCKAVPGIMCIITSQWHVMYKKAVQWWSFNSIT